MVWREEEDPRVFEESERTGPGTDVPAAAVLDNTSRADSAVLGP
jgi:hypothetical protein